MVKDPNFEGAHYAIMFTLLGTVFSNTPHTHLFRMFSSSNALNATDD
jgi:hypothetical protein